MTTIRLAVMLVLSFVIVGCGSEAPTDSTGSGDSKSSPDKTESKTAWGGDPSFDGPGREQGGLVLLNTSWGLPEEQPIPKRPDIVSYKAGQRQKFEREAAKRWQNTEIFYGK